MSKIIVIGASGQLGHCLQAVTKEKNISNFLFLKKEDANILDLNSLKALFRLHQPSCCINCAAYTAVDKAEDEPELAYLINRDGVANLSKLCNEYETTFVHVSTDYVFPGNGNNPLSEVDTVAPINVYGSSKLEGEKAILQYAHKFFIIRTSWLYSEFGNNFLKTILRVSKEREEIRVVWDQVGTPTYAKDLASLIVEIVKSNNNSYGVYHYSNEGITSWFDFAKAIVELRKTAVKVVPVRSSEYPLKAERPLFTAMDKSKVKGIFKIEIPYWRESLKNCITKL